MFLLWKRNHWLFGSVWSSVKRGAGTFHSRPLLKVCMSMSIIGGANFTPWLLCSSVAPQPCLAHFALEPFAAVIHTQSETWLSTQK